MREKLFENIGITSGVNASNVSKGAGEAVSGGGNAAPNKLLSFLGNTVWFGLLGSGAFVAYHQYRYTSDELQSMIQDSEKTNEGFSVRDYKFDIVLPVQPHFKPFTFCRCGIS